MWDRDVPQDLRNKFEKLMSDLIITKLEIPLSLPPKQEALSAIDLYVFL